MEKSRYRRTHATSRGTGAKYGDSSTGDGRKEAGDGPQRHGPHRQQTSPTPRCCGRLTVLLAFTFIALPLLAVYSHHQATNYLMQDETLAELRRLQRGLRIDDDSADGLDWFARPANLTVMSYNLRGANLDHEINTWSRDRRHVLANSLLKYRPSIVGTQEGIEEQLRDLMTLLPSSWRLFGNKRTSAPEDEHVALIYNSDEVEIIKGGDFWLSPTPDVPGSSAWGSAFPRMATWAKFKQLSTGHQFYIVNTHMDHVSEQARVEGARVLVETIKKLRKKNRAVILTGDFNAAPGQGSYEVLTRAGFKDAWGTSHQKGAILHHARTTFHHYFGTKLETWYYNLALYMGFRYHGGRFPHFGRYHIDWILYMNGDSQDDRALHPKTAISVELDTESSSDAPAPPETVVEPLCAMVCTDSENGQYPSDHYPILSVFELKRNGRSDSSVEEAHAHQTSHQELPVLLQEAKEIDQFVHDEGQEKVKQGAD